MSIMSGYKIMWMFVLFDLPVVTKSQRKSASKFRNDLLNLGFLMHQFSVYIKRCPGREKVDSLITKINKKLPHNGKVDIIWITDKQFADSIQIWEGIHTEKDVKKEENLMIF